ncbi:MAG: amidohydrolase family protein [Planctomycetes bacterium]|nr:amidohydrolase family protein [Planctomycetota bacterium]
MLTLLAAAGPALAALVPSDPPRPLLVVDVRLAPADDAKPHSILVRDGRIERIVEGRLDAPPDARTIEGQGALVLPGFVDAYSFTGCATPEPKAQRDLPPKTSTDVLIDMRAANRKGIQPAFRAADVFEAGEALEDWRKQGFGALLSAPSGQLLAGTSALVVTRQAATRDAIVRESVFDHASFRAGGSGYPGTLMGSIAQIRQFLLDAARHGEILRRRAQGQPGPRPPFDPDLLAAQELLAGRRVVCAAVDAADDVDRFAALAEAHSLRLAVAGGREAWKRAKLLAARQAPVILTPPGGEEPADPDSEDTQKKKKEPKAEDAPWTYTEPLASKREKRRVWAEERDGARVLAEAGVRIAFGTGKEKPKDLLERVRKLVAGGLPREVALTALTAGAAEILGAPGLGRLEHGADATFALWTKDPLVEKAAAVRWMFVDGHAHEFTVEAQKDAKQDGAEGPGEGVDASGTWAITFEDPAIPKGLLEITMKKDGAVEGTLRGTSPAGEPVSAAMAGTVRGTALKLSGLLVTDDFRAELVFEGLLDGDVWKGSLSGVLPQPVGFEAQRTPKREETR